MNVPMIFENHEVEIIEVNGQILFNPRHVGACLEIEEVTVRRHIQEMSEKHVVKITNLDVGSMNIRKLNNAGENFLTESGVYKLVFKSRKPEAEKFTDWIANEVLPSIRKTGSFIKEAEKPRTEEFEMELIGVKYVSDILNMSEVSKLKLLHKAYEMHGQRKDMLPAYVEKKRVSFSATKLLDDRGKPMSTVAFNKLMLADGFIEEKERPAFHGTVRKFKMLTNKGLQYGENLVSQKNEKEVQPYYYEDSFDALLNHVTHLPGDEND